MSTPGRDRHKTGTTGRVLIGGGLLLVLSLPLMVSQEKPARAVAPKAIPAQVVDPAAAPEASGATYVGSAACKACHSIVHAKWTGSAHGKALESEAAPENTPENMKGCEACHGPASLHVGSRGQVKLTMPTASDVKGTNALCGGCHLQSDTSRAPKEWQNLSSTNFAHSMHGRKGVSCLQCHSAHPSANDKQLLKPARELCLSCHGKVLESAPGKKAAYTHMPIAQAQCSTCHDPHGTPDRTMVIENVQKACLQCHDVADPKIATAHKGFPMADANCADCHDPHSHDQKGHLLKAKQHMPFKQGNCETCHTKPAAGQPVGLVKPVKELCITCHPASKLMPENEHAHLPAKEGMCLSCHSPHASTQKALMKSRPANQCFTCHSKIENDTLLEHKHAVLDSKLDCLQCHKPHSSPEPKLMVQNEQAMCGQCHKHSFSHPIGKRADGTPILNPLDGDQMTCSSCHDMHGSTHEALTIADKGRDLCVKCHRDLEP